MCRVCHRTLDMRTDETGVTYLHPIAAPADHEPVPVAPDAEWRVLCDFCAAEGAAFTLPVRDFTDRRTGAHSSGDWAACAGCARLIERDEWTALVRRVALAFERRNAVVAGEGIRQHLQALYRTLRAAIAGPLRAFEPPAATDDG